MNAIKINFLGVTCIAFYYVDPNDLSITDLDRLEINGQCLDLVSLAIIASSDLKKAKNIENYIVDLIEIELKKSAE